MVIKSEEMKSEVRESMRGGPGSAAIKHIVTGEALPGNCRLFSVITLNKGCGIGGHAHEQESEIFYVLQGEAALDDNGRRVVLKAGDAHVCASGESHGIVNEKDEPLVLVAAIVLE
jgi:quercetin dioxygenase-like cupin family protein